MLLDGFDGSTLYSIMLFYGLLMRFRDRSNEAVYHEVGSMTCGPLAPKQQSYRERCHERQRAHAVPPTRQLLPCLTRRCGRSQSANIQLATDSAKSGGVRLTAFSRRCEMMILVLFLKCVLSTCWTTRSAAWSMAAVTSSSTTMLALMRRQRAIARS